MRTKVTAKYVVGFENDDHVIYVNGVVVYEDDTIIYVGHAYPGEVDQIIESGNSLVSPGLIDLNALGDIDHDIVHLEAPASARNSLLWSEDYFLRGSHDAMSPEEEAFKSLYAYLHLICNGTTTAMPITSVLYKGWAETYEELAAAVDHAGRLGLRIYLGPSYQCGTNVVKKDGSVAVGFDIEKGKAGLRRAVEFVRNFDGAYGGLVRGMLAPERVENQTSDVLVETRRWSDEFGCPIKLHAAQGLFEFNEIRRVYGKTPIRYLYDLGFLGEKSPVLTASLLRVIAAYQRLKGMIWPCFGKPKPRLFTAR